MRTIAMAVAGFAGLLAVVPSWATETLLLFGALYAVLVLLVDDELRVMLRRERAKRPASRRAAT